MHNLPCCNEYFVQLLPAVSKNNILSTLSKTDTFGTGTKCPSQRDVRLIKSQIKGISKGTDQFQVSVLQRCPLRESRLYLSRNHSLLYSGFDKYVHCTFVVLNLCFSELAHLPYLAVLNFWQFCYLLNFLPTITNIFAVNQIIRREDPAITNNFSGTVALHYGGVPLYQFSTDLQAGKGGGWWNKI